MNKLTAFVKKYELYILILSMSFWRWIFINYILNNETNKYYFLILPLFFILLNVFNLLNYFNKKQNK